MADLTNIFEPLIQSIDESSFPYISPKRKYQEEQHCAERHLQWLEEHLGEEGKAHLEGFRNAELNISTLECEASIKIALAIGIRLALPN